MTLLRSSDYFSGPGGNWSTWNILVYHSYPVVMMQDVHSGSHMSCDLNKYTIFFG